MAIDNPFQNKNQSAANNPGGSQSPSEINQKPLSDAGQFTGNIQVHTMKSDIEDSRNPLPETGYLPPKPGIAKQEITEKQKTSPFLNPKNEDIPMPSEIESKSGSTTKTVILSGIVVFIILILAFGGYYYWLTSVDTQKAAQTTPIPTDETKTETPIDVPDETPKEIPTQPTIPEISVNKPNYLILDIEKLNNVQVKEEIVSYANKAASLDSTTPIEFIVTNSNNAPIPFSQFASKIEVSLSSEVQSYLGDDFNLYVYGENHQPHLGLIIDMKNSIDAVKLKDAMLKEEPTLEEKIQPLFLTSSLNQSLSGKKFSTSAYKGAAVRYINIKSPDELSVDYSIFRNKLVFATTKNAAFSLIDKINSSTPKN